MPQEYAAHYLGQGRFKIGDELDRARGESGLDVFHLLLHPRSLFHEFFNAGHRFVLNI